MPPAVALAVPAVAGAGASASEGKKGQNAAKKQAQQQFQFQQKLFDTGMQAWQPSANYFQSLLSGDPTRMAEATGPARDAIRGQQQAASRQMAATTPAGGEANAAQAALQQQGYSDIARLTAGVQPQAAQALGQLAGVPIQTSAPNVGSGIKAQQNLANENMGKAGQIGSGLGGKVARAGSGGPKSSWGQVFGKGSPASPPAPVPA